jgi:sn-glycerol 3-phosphate transport system ATP-binding protein
VLESGAQLQTNTKTSGKVTLGIRPEHLVLDEKGKIKIEVDLLEQLGSNTLVHGRLEGTQSPIVISLDGIQTINAGVVLSFDAPPLALHLFDVETEKRIEE